MVFPGREEIIKEFHIDNVNNDKELLTKLKALMYDAHPDRGIEKTDDKFKRLSEVIEYIETYSTDIKREEMLVPYSDFNKLVEINKQLVIRNEELYNKLSTELINKLTEPAINRKEENLSKNIDRSMKIFNTNAFRPTYTAAGFTTIITIILGLLWAAPTGIKDNPALSTLINIGSPFFIDLWLISAVLLIVLFIIYKIKENKEKEFLSWLNYEPVQNVLFTVFEYSKITNLTYAGTKISFTKDEFINYLINRVDYYYFKNNPLKYSKNITSKNITLEIESYYNRILDNRERRKLFIIINRTSVQSPNSKIDILKPYKLLFKSIYDIYYFIFPKVEVVKYELAHSLAELILQRVEKNGLIKKSTEKSLYDKYTFE